MQEDKPAFNLAKVEAKLANVKSLSDLTGSNGVIQEMIKGTVERILKAEQEVHLGYEPYEEKGPVFVGHSRELFEKKRKSQIFS